jgi:NAD-dependent deacetylase
MIERLARARDLLGRGGPIVCFSGAGLSAESGLSTFRDRARGGLWARHDPMTLASPEGFHRDPDLVLAWYAWRREAVARASPNAGHLALAARRDVAHVTQNVDDLLERAGAAGVVHLHGIIGSDRCHGGCGHQEPVDLLDPPGRRPCRACGAEMRPAVVWFGESLPPDAWSAATEACASAAVLLVVGTSGVVQPAASLVGLARHHGARVVVVNTEATEAGSGADLELRGPAAEILPRILSA